MFSLQVPREREPRGETGGEEVSFLGLIDYLGAKLIDNTVVGDMHSCHHCNACMSLP